MGENIMEAIESGDFETLFDLEIAALEERACFHLTLKDLRRQRAVVLKRAQENTFTKEWIPFLPAIPRIHFGGDAVNWLISMVKLGDASGRSILAPDLLIDFGAIPDQPYWIFDVEDGADTKDVDPWIAQNVIFQRQRLPLTTTEIISLCAIFDVLSPDRKIIAAGSRFEGARIPQLQIYEGRPLLGLAASSIGSHAPSCGFR